MKSFIQHADHLDYFTGKLCSILTLPVHTSMFPDKDFQQKQNIGYFVGRIDQITPMGIWTTHPVTNNRNFFFREHVVGICEEQVIDENHPDFEEINKLYEIKKNTNEVLKTPKGFVPPTVPHSTGKHVDIAALEEMSRKQKEKIR